MGHHYEQLLEWERNEIFRLRSAGVSQAEIGRRLGRHGSTISRELRRNRVAGGYQPVAAERLAQQRRHARRMSKIERLSRLDGHIRDHLAMGQSPEQIAGRLKLVEPTLSISHESIYRFIHTPAGRRERLHNYLTQRKSRRGRRARLGQSKPLIPDRISIHARPPAIKRKLAFGHWEGDLMSFNRHNAVVLTEQKSRFILVARQDDKTSLTTAGSIKKLFAGLPRRARGSITFDNGGEFARHKSLGFETYFCDPHSPWQKGGVENAIGRLRRDLPNATRRTDYSDADFQQLITIYNDTPRKCLDYRTPAEAWLHEIRTRRCT
jgi:IS30 family transposase